MERFLGHVSAWLRLQNCPLLVSRENLLPNMLSAIPSSNARLVLRSKTNARPVAPDIYSTAANARVCFYVWSITHREHFHVWMFVPQFLVNLLVHPSIWLATHSCFHLLIHPDSCKSYVREINSKATGFIRARLTDVWEDDCDWACCSQEWCHGFNYQKTTKVIGRVPASTAMIHWE